MQTFTRGPVASVGLRRLAGQRRAIIQSSITPRQEWRGDKERAGMGRFTVAAACSLALFSGAALGPTQQARAQEFAYCRADLQRLCHGVRPGGGRIKQCLKAHENDLTVGCAKELRSMKARMGK